MPPETPSAGTCGRSSLFLCRALCARGFPAVWVTGTFAPDGDATPKRHAWVASDGFIIDITAAPISSAPGRSW